MAYVSDNVEVNVGETEIGQVYVGNVDLGEIRRDVEIDISPELFWDNCSEAEKAELAEFVCDTTDLLKHGLEECTESAIELNVEAIKTVLEETFEYGTIVISKDPVTVEDIRNTTDERLQNLSAFPSGTLLSVIKTFLDMDPKQIQALPRTAVAAVQEKFIGAMDPVKVEKVPNQLRNSVFDLIERLEKGEVIAEETLTELKKQL